MKFISSVITALGFAGMILSPGCESMDIFLIVFTCSITIFGCGGIFLSYLDTKTPLSAPIATYQGKAL